MKISKALPLSAFWVFTLAVLAFSQGYTFSTIKSPPNTDRNSIDGRSINNYGTVLVDYISSITSAPKIAKIFSTGSTIIKTPYQYSYAINLSNIGEIGGTAYNVDRSFGFLMRKDGEFLIYSAPNKWITGGGATNDFSHKVFSVRDRTKTDLFSGAWLANGISHILDYPGSTWTDANGINNTDEVIGDFYDGSQAHGYLYSKGQFYQIDFPGATSTFLNCINNLGEIGGFFIDKNSEAHGFVYQSGKFTQIDYPTKDLVWTTINGINDHGKIIGTYLVINLVLVNGLERFAFVASPK